MPNFLTSDVISVAVISIARRDRHLDRSVRPGAGRLLGSICFRIALVPRDNGPFFHEVNRNQRPQFASSCPYGKCLGTPSSRGRCARAVIKKCLHSTFKHLPLFLLRCLVVSSHKALWPSFCLTNRKIEMQRGFRAGVKEAQITLNSGRDFRRRKVSRFLTTLNRCIGSESASFSGTGQLIGSH